MAQLLVRNLDAALVRELKLRAARNGRSMEAEHRAILAATLRGGRARRSLKELLLAMPGGAEDADFARIGGDVRPVDL